MSEKKHYTVVDFVQYGLGAAIGIGGIKFAFSLPEDPNYIHLAIIGGFFLVSGSLLKIPGFRSTLSKLVERFVPKAEESEEDDS